MHKLLHTYAALADLGQEIAETSDFQEMANTALCLLLGSLAIRKGALAEFNKATRTLKFIAARGINSIHQQEIELDDAEIESFQQHSFCGVLVGEELPAFARFTERHQGLLKAMRAEVLIPMVVRGDFTGLVLLGEKASGESFKQDDRDLICSMSRHIGMGIHTHRLLMEVEERAADNRRLYEGQRAIYQDTVRAFAAAIDIKDKYTQGHSERVGKYSEIIARELGWSELEIEGIAVAGYLHDVGKLVVERDIINAPYRIDAKQSSELNRHPAAGYEILKPIQHLYADIPLMARYHHERIDGRGYPDGLKGDEIPFGAKIISLADSFDAMTTDRPYKKRRVMEEVIEDFRRTTGKQFAKEVVIAFCQAILKEVNGETKERNFAKLLGKDYLKDENIGRLLTELIAELSVEGFPTHEIKQATSREGISRLKVVAGDEQLRPAMNHL
jgi:hypothetical protein